MQSEKTDQLALALSKVQASLRPALRTSTNPFFHSKYAPLDVVWDACRSQLGANGFAVAQTTSVAPSCLVTTLLHSSGQWISGSYPLPEIQDPQKFASAVTYARRYALASLVGVVSPEEDDDGNFASSRDSAPQVRMAPAKTAPAPAPQAKEAVSDITKLFDAKVVSQQADENPLWFLEVEFKIGKYKGQRLKDAPPKSVQWYVENFEPKAQYPDSVHFRKALDAYGEWGRKQTSAPKPAPAPVVHLDDDGNEMPF